MMQRKICNDAKMKCNGPNKSHDETRKPWKASEAPVLGRYIILITFPLYMPASLRTKEEEGEEAFGGRDGEWRGIGREEELKEDVYFSYVYA